MWWWLCVCACVQGGIPRWILSACMVMSSRLKRTPCRVGVKVRVVGARVRV